MSEAQGVTTLSGARTTAVVTVLVMGMVALGIGQAPAAHALTVAAKISPAAAPVATGITIAGEGLEVVTGVTFLGDAAAGDEVVAPHFIVLDPKKLVVQVPDGAQSGAIELATPTGPVSTAPVTFTVFHAPSITSLSATSGRPGTAVSIFGDNLLGAKKPKVMFGSKSASPLDTSSQTELQLLVPGVTPGGPVSVSVTTTGGTAYSNFYISPEVKGIGPAKGTTAGGTIASITGTGLTGVDNFVDDPATPAVDERFDGVTIGGVNVTGLIAVSDKEAVVRIPPGVDPAAPVVVRTTKDGVVGTSGNASVYAYQPLPSVTSLSQNWSAPDSPSSLVATGVNFDASTVVKVGATVVTPTDVNPTAGTITFTPPVSAKAGVTAVSFTNTDAAGAAFTATAPFAYVVAPTVAKIAPVTGQQGTSVIVTGTGFGSGTSVTFGGAGAACTVESFVQLRCTAPAGAVGPADVVVTNGVGVSTPAAASQFTYLAGIAAPAAPVGAPIATAFLPAYGATGSTVGLKGANLHKVTKVEFSGPDGTWVEAPNFMVVGPARLVAKVPSGIVTGELRLTHAGGVVRTTNRKFLATVVPSVDSIDAVGDTSYGVTPGDMVKIRGAGLTIKGAKTVVTIGGKIAPVLTKPVPTAKTIVVKVPAAIGGRAPVVVTTPLGTDTSDLPVYYIPEFKGAKPATYDRSGGTVVTIAGMGFTGADNVTVGVGRRQAVTFDGIPVAKMVQMNDKTLVVVTAAGSASADDMVVTTQHDGKTGNSDGKTRSADAPIPQLTAVTPNTGPTGPGASPITLTGQKLTVSTVVRFGGVPGAVQSAAPDGTSAVVVPPVQADPGTVSITLTNLDDGDELTTTMLDAYTYELQPAVITGMSASTALPGTLVTLTGSSFVDVTSVKFGAVEVPYTMANSATLFVTVPATPAGASGTVVEVSVVNATGSPSTANPATANDWTWDNSPSITSLSASTGDRGTTVTINGSNFVGVTGVRFGFTPATAYTVVDANTITATVPSTPVGAGGQTVDIVVQIGASTSLAATPTADNWTWRSPANISAMSAHTGPAGTVVTVTGTGFLGTTAVAINGRAATSFAVIDDLSLTFVVPAAAANGGNSPGRLQSVTVTNGSGLPSTINPAGAADWLWQ